MRHLLLLFLGSTFLFGCATTQKKTQEALDPTTFTQVKVHNPTVDSQRVIVNGILRGTVLPKDSLDVIPVQVGNNEFVFKTTLSGLEQRKSLVLTEGQHGELSIPLQTTDLTVTNATTGEVDVLVDGKMYGRALPEADTLIKGVPAGKRLIVVKAVKGPGAIRIDKTLYEGSDSLVLPALMHEFPKEEAQKPN